MSGGRKNQERGPFRLRGRLLHAPRRGALEALDDAIVHVDAEGTIAQVERGKITDQADGAGPLVTLAPNQVLLPGMVDLHIHAPQWPQAGAALDLPLADWLQNCTFPLEARYADTAFAETVYRSLVASLLANGTTTALYFATAHLEASVLLAEICLAFGQRGLVGKVVMDDPEQCPDYYRDASAASALADTESFIDRVRSFTGNDGLVMPVVTPRFIPSCTDEALEGLGRLAQAHDCHVQTHISESDWQHGFVEDRLAKSDASALDGFGLMGRKSVFAHGNLLSDDDLSLIGSRSSAIAHCPLSNFYFSNAVFPLRKALDMGLHLGLGTDISGGAHPSLIAACGHAVTASRALEDGVDASVPGAQRGTPGARIDFREAFWMATAGGGEALDLPVGVLAPGYRFDAIAIETNRADSNLIVWDGFDRPDDILQKIIYLAARDDIRTVWVDGRRVIDKDASG